MLEFLAFCGIWVFCSLLNIAVFNLTFNRGEGKRLFSLKDAEGLEELLFLPFIFAPFITLMLPLIGVILFLFFLAEKIGLWCGDNINLPNWINPEI